MFVDSIKENIEIDKLNILNNFKLLCFSFHYYLNCEKIFFLKDIKENIINNFFFELNLILSEIFLIIFIIILIIFSLFLSIRNNENIGSNIYLTFLGLIIVILLYINNNIDFFVIFNSSYISISFLKLSKLFLIVLLFLCLIISIQYFYNEILFLYEYIIIILFSIVGMFFLLCSNDLLSMFLSLEMQSFGLYILATYKKNKIFSTEAGLKYFIIGGVSTCFLLFGCSLVYGFSGLIYFNDINLFMYSHNFLEIYFNPIFIGFILIIVAFLLKLGSAPFHVWVPDVYEGVPTILTLFFTLVPKITIFLFILKLYFYVFTNFFYFFHYLFFVCILLCFIIGVIGAIYQIKIKRLLAYSSIGHLGFILISLLSSKEFMVESLIAGFFYLIIYAFIILIIFLILLSLRNRNNNLKIKLINEFKNIIYSNIYLGFMLSFNIYSLAGIPPLAGFFSKLYIFFSALNENYYLIILLSLVFSGIGAFYYLRLIKNMFFREYFIKTFYISINLYQSYIISIFTMFNICFFFYPKIILDFVQLELIKNKKELILNDYFNS